MSLDIDALSRSLVERGATLGEACRTLSTPECLEACDARLREDPAFRRLHDVGGETTIPDVELAASMPEGSLGRWYARYMAHYRLSPNFFPIAQKPGSRPSPTEYAVCRLNDAHDFFHVLGGYETHDADEVAVQSFVFGHNPVVQAAFLATAAAHPSLRLARYKHLRDIYDGPIRREDYERGREAAPLLGLAFEQLLAQPLALLRQRLGIRPRIERAPITSNSCGGAVEAAFFPEARNP